MSFIKHVFFYASEKSIKFNNPQNLHALPETELAILVANHLLGKLATTSCYIVDKNCTGKQGDGCCCGVDSCRMTGEYGDTSIGKYIAVYKYRIGNYPLFCTRSNLSRNYSSLRGFYDASLE